MKSMTARENHLRLSLCEQSDIFYLLSHHRKRGVLLAIAMAPWGHVHLRQLAEIIAAHSKQILNNEEYQLNK